MTVYVDVSSNNDGAGVDLAAHYRAGYRYLMLKASEGLGYYWPNMNNYARRWHALGGDARCGYYHWLYGTESGPAQAAYFMSHYRPVWRAGDWTMTDFEDVDPSRWIPDRAHRDVLAAFDLAVTGDGHAHDVYAPNWYLSNLPVTRAYLQGRRVVASNYNPQSPPPNPYGFRLTAHQYTDRLNVAGFPRPVDANRWLINNPTGDTVSPTVKGTPDVALTEAEIKAIADAVWSRQLVRLDPATGKPNSGVHTAAVWTTGVSAQVGGLVELVAKLPVSVAAALPQSATGFTLDQVVTAVRQAVLHLAP